MPYDFSYGSMSDVSARAKKREDEAKHSFLAAKAEFDGTESIKTLPFGHTIQLVKPDCLLTRLSFDGLRTFVEENHPGWTAKPKVATAEELLEEKSQGRCSPSRGKSYFVDVFYQKKRKATPKAVPEEEEDSKPPAKKSKPEPPKNRVAAFGFGALDISMQLMILAYADVPTLGSLVRVSKAVGELAKSDNLWSPHLKFLLHEPSVRRT
jgi:hypothetical protein